MPTFVDSTTTLLCRKLRPPAATVLFKPGVNAGFAPTVVLSHLIIKGRLHESVASGLIAQAWVRHLDSLLGAQWPSSEYYAQ